MRIATPAFFCFPFTWNIFFHPLTFCLYVSLNLKWVSCRQHMYRSYFCIHSASLCLLVGAFNPFTFKVIIDIYVPIAIFLIVWSWFCRSFSSLVFLDCISPFNICCKAGLEVLNSLNFCLSEKLFISPSILNENLSGYSNLGCIFSPFSTLDISCHSLLACRISPERSTVKPMGFPLYVTCCFSLAAFNILSLCLVFVSLISICLGVFLLGFLLDGTLRASWIWLTVSFSMLGTCRDSGSIKCAGTWTGSTTGVMALSVSFLSSCSWQSEGFFGQSFSIALPIQALTGLPCLGFFSVSQCFRHIEEPPWMGFYSVAQHITHLKEHPGWGPAL